MKITLVCDILGKEDNGTTIATMNFLRHLQKHHDVTILCCDPTKKDEPHYIVTGRKKFPGPFQKFVDNTGFALAKVNKKLVEKAVIGADIVHCFEPFALSMAAIKVARKHHIPVTASVHLLPEHITYQTHLNLIPGVAFCIYRYWWDHTYRKVNAIHFPTEFTKNLFNKRIYSARYRQEYVVSNGINPLVKQKDVAKPKELKDKIVILCCGRYVPEKAQRTLIRAVKRSKYKDKIQLIFAGKGQKLKTYQRQGNRLPIKPIFKRFDHKELIDVINYSDFYIHPAVLETEGIAVLEAIACGKLVIVSNAKKSAPRTFGITNDCIFYPRSAKSLAGRIDYWIEHPELKKQREKLNLALGKKYNLELCMQQLEQMLKEVKNKSIA